MSTALIKYDAARKAIAAAHRVDEAKKIRDKAEAVRTYARLAGDLQLQNQACEIRLRAERRAGQLLLDMEKNPGTRGAGRPRKDGAKRRSAESTAKPPKLDEIGITKDQSSKWQRLALLVDESTFERALVQALEKNGELSNSALLREIREITTPTEVLTDPDVNVIASELIREIESASRREKLETVVRLRKRLNPTLTKKLVLALSNSANNLTKCETQLSKDFEDYPANGKAFQRVIRERMAEQPDPLFAEKKALASDFKNASVREISLEDARNVIVGHEYLGTLGSAEFAYGLFFGKHLAGTVTFGSTAGTAVKRSVLGAVHAGKVISLTRGCCLPWADPLRQSSDGRVHTGAAASYLISAACRLLTARGYHCFIAYADPAAGERGRIFRACNFLYCGTTSPTEKFRRPDGKVYDARNVHLLTRDRRFGMLRYKRSRAEQKRLLMEEGCEFFKDDRCKHRFVGIFGDRRIKRTLRAALQWEVMEYPEQAPSSEAPVQIVQSNLRAKAFAVSVP
ncbi:MAG TPA: hypothetical protein VNZ03_15505 [Terriglobales bacterium]|jgi:hypothetical protein|nr:hypothetical protein [Terriglobales bacterium]